MSVPSRSAVSTLTLNNRSNTLDFYEERKNKFVI